MASCCWRASSPRPAKAMASPSPASDSPRTPTSSLPIWIATCPGVTATTTRTGSWEVCCVSTTPSGRSAPTGSSRRGGSGAAPRSPTVSLRRATVRSPLSTTSLTKRWPVRADRTGSARDDVDAASVEDLEQRPAAGESGLCSSRSAQLCAYRRPSNEPLLARSAAGPEPAPDPRPAAEQVPYPPPGCSFTDRAEPAPPPNQEGRPGGDRGGWRAAGSGRGQGAGAVGVGAQRFRPGILALRNGEGDMPTAEELISVASIERLASILSAVAPGDSDWAEVRASAATLGPLGLSDRARTVRDALLRDLPGGYPRLAAVVRAALERPDLSGWMVWPVNEAVAATATATSTAAAGPPARLLTLRTVSVSSPRSARRAGRHRAHDPYAPGRPRRRPGLRGPDHERLP